MSRDKISSERFLALFRRLDASLVGHRQRVLPGWPMQGHPHEAKSSPPRQCQWMQRVDANSRAGFARLCVSCFPPWLLTVRHWHQPGGASGTGQARTQRSPASSCRLRPGPVAHASGASVRAVSSPTRQSAPVERAPHGPTPGAYDQRAHTRRGLGSVPCWPLRGPNASTIARGVPRASASERRGGRWQEAKRGGGPW